MHTSTLRAVCRKHSGYTEGCFRCRIETVAIAPSATGSEQAREVNEREARWHADMKSYRAIRRNGLQPKSIDGSAALEGRAEDQFEIQTGHLFNKQERKHVRNAINRARDLGVDLVSEGG